MKTIKIPDDMVSKIIDFCDDELNYHINESGCAEQYQDESETEIFLLRALGQDSIADHYEEQLKEYLEEVEEEPVKNSKINAATVSDSIAEMYYVIAYTYYVPDGDINSPNVTLDVFLSKSETFEEEFHNNEQGTESGVFSVKTIEEVIDSIKNNLTSLKFGEDISEEERKIIETAVKCSKDPWY